MTAIVKRKSSKSRNRQKANRYTAAWWLPRIPKKWRRLSPSLWACIPLAFLIVALWSTAASAQEEELTPEYIKGVLNTIWIVVASVLVIFMNAGFGMLETGFCRQKNAVNILSKNLIVFALATLIYWAIGFSFMYGQGGGFIGGGGWFLSSNDPATYGLSPFPEGLPIPVSFLFQVAFAATAATIVSGAVAERVRFSAFIVFSLLLVGISYAITGHWTWGGGWLNNVGDGFQDFAGSTIVHSVGGWAALMGAYWIGPRTGKYEDGRPRAIPGHNMSLATLGCLILWIGWFGFNPGSELAATENVPYLAVTTNLSAAAGGVAATIVSTLRDGKPDISMIINGILGGLVAITAGCDAMTYGGAAVTGAVAGVLVVFAVPFFDTVLKIDDPVGAISVHLVNGAWGTLAVAFPFLTQAGSTANFSTQIIGILSIGLFTVVASSIFWLVLKVTLGIRVSEEEEKQGLDIGEHGMEAYHGFIKEASK